MKKVILIMIALSAIVFSGCSTRMTPSVASSVAQMYDTTKTIWVKGQEIVVINSDLLDNKTLSILEEIDEKARRIDATKEAIIDGNTSSLLKESDRVQRTMEVINR